MKRLMQLCALPCLAALSTQACTEQGEPIGDTNVAIDIAALTLTGVGDAVWDIEVVNGASPTPAVVWQKRIASSQFGNGAGSAGFVGPCDADPAVAQNTVKLWLVGVYSAPVTSVGTFASGASGGVAGSAIAFVNPSATAPITQTLTCAANADTAVRFDVAIMRPAEQGFFDIAVTFDDIFCSAKFDCCDENAGGTACASDLKLLHNASGIRDTTMVLGFACTGGVGSTADTNLWLDALALDCSSPSASLFASDFNINPALGEGNDCAAGNVAACAAVATVGSLNADNYLYQIASYRGVEQATSNGQPANIAFWNVALGVKKKVASGPGIQDCWLRARGTVDDAAGSAQVTNGIISAGVVYPYVQWDVNLATCMEEPLTFGSSTAPVRPAYTTTSGIGTGFPYGFGPNLPAGNFACGNGTKSATEGCDDGNTVGGDGCSSTCAVEANFSCSGTAPSVCTCAYPDIFNWASWSSISGTQATGSVGGTPVTVTSTNTLESRIGIQNGDHFPAVYGVPQGVLTIQNRNISTHTVSFGQAVTNPVLVFASIGNTSLQVNIDSFVNPTTGAALTITPLFLDNHAANAGPSPSVAHSTTATSSLVYGKEGNAIVRLNGTHTGVRFNYTVAENSVNFGFGYSTRDPRCVAP